jgi:hypothetical protein
VGRARGGGGFQEREVWPPASATSSDDRNRSGLSTAVRTQVGLTDDNKPVITKSRDTEHLILPVRAIV